MLTLRFTHPDGSGESVEAEIGATLCQTALDHSVPGILGDCGGNCTCGTCHARIDTVWRTKLPAPSSLERDILDGVPDTDESSRLLCQITVTPDLDGLVVAVPASQY